MTFFPKSFLLRKEIGVIPGWKTNSGALWVAAPVVTEKSESSKSLGTFQMPRETTADHPSHRQGITEPRAGLYILHQQNRAEYELQMWWCGKSSAWVVFNRLSVSEGDLPAIAVPYVTQSYSLFHIMCLQSVIPYSYISHFMIIKLQIQKKMWIHKITPIWTCSSNKLFWQDVLTFFRK